jgi:hypothetical protein
MTKMNIVFDVERIKTGLEEKSRLINICNTIGRHTSSERGAIISRMGNIRVYDVCSRCHLPYERAPTLKEIEEYNHMLNREFIV